MNQLDLLYRAFTDYKKQLSDNKDYAALLNAASLSNDNLSEITLQKNICTVDEDWIEAIETKLIHFVKAIEQNRQFIRSQGEVIPIEKVKRVSKESTLHLASHSNLITKEPKEGEKLIPDGLYTVERLTDFAVYENKFLYMALCFLKSFISFRFDIITKLTNTYLGTLDMDKTINTNKRKITFNLKLRDEKFNDEYLEEINPIKSILDRIDTILKTVTYLLNTPLMQEIAKVPPLKPPVTKTNVLKMDTSFKGAMALYEYLISYGKPGYTVKTVIEKLSPLSEDIQDELSGIIILSSFLTYQHSLRLEKMLKESFNAENIRLKQLEAEKQKELLLRLRRQIAESGLNAEEYMLLMEKRNKALENELNLFEKTKQLLNESKEEIRLLTENITLLNNVIDEKNHEIFVQKQAFNEEILRLNTIHTEEINSLVESNKLALIKQEDEFNQKIALVTEAHNEKLTALSTLLDTQKTEFEEAVIAEKQKTADALSECDNQIALFKQIADEKTELYQNLSDQNTILQARITALRKQQGLIANDEDYTSKPSFTELERQLKIFKEFFNSQWGKTKKAIRKEVFKEAKNKDINKKSE